MTKDYKNGKIYRIVSKTGKQYVGSTVETLSQRLSRHRGYIKDKTNQGISSVIILKEDPNAKIVLLEKYPCSSSEELRAREQYWIENIEGGCINFIRSHTTPEINKEKSKIRYIEKIDEIREYKAQYYLDTYEPEYHTVLNNLFKTPDDLAEEERIRKEKKRKSDAEYRAKNLEKVRAIDRAYLQREDVKQKKRERTKQWAQDNKQRADVWKKEKIECECGSTITRSGLSAHRKMKKHLTFEKKKIII